MSILVRLLGAVIAGILYPMVSNGRRCWALASAPRRCRRCRCPGYAAPGRSTSSSGTKEPVAQLGRADRPDGGSGGRQQWAPVADLPNSGRPSRRAEQAQGVEKAASTKRRAAETELIAATVAAAEGATIWCRSGERRHPEYPAEPAGVVPATGAGQVLDLPSTRPMSRADDAPPRRPARSARRRCWRPGGSSNDAVGPWPSCSSVTP